MSRNLPCRVTSSTKLPLQRGQRRVEGLQRAERRDVDAGDRAAVQPAAQVERQAFDFGQLGHGASLGVDRVTVLTGRFACDTGLMHPVTPLPAAGEVFLDARGDGRALRVSWHAEADVVVLSLWRGGTCTGTFRLPVEDVPDLIDALRDGLARSYDVHRARLARRRPARRLTRGPARPGRGPVDVRLERYDSLAKSTDSARRADTVRAWTRSGTPTPPAPASARPSSPAATGSCSSSRSPSSGSPPAAPSARWCSPGCAASARPCCSTRCAAWRCKRAWGTGKLEARPDQSLRLPLAQAVHAAVREVAHRHRDPDRVDAVAGVVKSFALRTPLPDRKGVRWQPPTDVPATKGRADSGDLELDLIELFTDVADLARDLGVGIALFVDEMQDIATAELAALCGACHEISQQGAPLVVVGAGLPHLPVALAASKSYAERLFRYVVVDRLPREMADRALLVPGRHRGRRLRPPTRSTSSTC